MSKRGIWNDHRYWNATLDNRYDQKTMRKRIYESEKLFFCTLIHSDG
jgi:hypothetical protein